MKTGKPKDMLRDKQTESDRPDPIFHKNSTTLEEPSFGFVPTLLVTLLIHIPLIAARSADPIYLHAFSVDEYVLLETVRELQSYITSGDWGKVFTFTLQFSYGFLFYFLYAIVTLPWAETDSFTAQLVAGRMIGVIAVAASIHYIARIIRLIGVEKRVATVFALLLLVMPGHLLYQKFFSAEQMSTLLLIISIYFLCLDRLATKRNAIIAAALYGASLSVKLNGALFGMSFLAYGALALTMGWRKLDLLRRTKVLGLCLISSCAAFIGCNISAFTTLKGFKSYISWITTQVESGNSGHHGAFPMLELGERLSAWIGNNPLSATTKFMPAWIIIICVVSAIVLVVLKLADRREFKLEEINIPIITLFSFVVPSAYVIFTSDKIWDWYLIQPFFFSIIGVAGVAASLSNRLGKRWLLWGSSLVFSGILVYANSGTWWNWYQDRISEHKTLRFQQIHQDAFEFEHQLAKLIASPRRITTNSQSASPHVLLHRFLPHNPEKLKFLGATPHFLSTWKITAAKVRELDPDFVVPAFTHSLAVKNQSSVFAELESLRVTPYGRNQERLLYPVQAYGNQIIYEAVPVNEQGPPLFINKTLWTVNDYEAEILFARAGLTIRSDKEASGMQYLHGIRGSTVVVPFFVEMEGDYAVEIVVKSKHSRRAYADVRFAGKSILNEHISAKSGWLTFTVPVGKSIGPGMVLIHINVNEIGLDKIRLFPQEPE